MLGHSAISETPLSSLPAAGGTSVTVTPGIDTLVLTGLAPTVTATSNVTVTPGIDTLVLTGQAPTVSATSNVSVTPAPDTLVLTGYAPTVTVPTSVTVTPGVGALTITGYAPGVVSGPDVSTFDTHDGSPRKDTSSEGQRDREKRNKETLHQAIEEAMAQTLGLPRPTALPVEVEAPKPVPARPINREHRRAIADLLARSGIAPRDEYSVREIEAEIKTVERKLRETEARRRAEDEEDEEDVILLLLS